MTTKRRDGIARAQALLALQDSARQQARANDFVVLFVQQARDAGCSWADIGSVFGISRSAAFQRYAHLPRVRSVR